MDLNFKPMEKLFRLFVFTLTAGLASSCIPDPLAVDDIAQLKPKIVVSTQIVPGGALVVLITRSVGALDAGRGSDPQALLSQITLDSAKVWLSRDGRVDQFGPSGQQRLYAER
jgi:hypothetical protein